MQVAIGGVRPNIPVGEALLPLVVTDGEQAQTRMLCPDLVFAARRARGSRPRRGARRAAGQAPAGRQRRRSRGRGEPAPGRDRERSDLLLTLYNRTGAPLIAGEWGPWPPTLTLVFDTADGPPGHDALTTASRLDDIEVVVERGTGWRVVKRSPGPDRDLVAVAIDGRGATCSRRARSWSSQFAA